MKTAGIDVHKKVLMVVVVDTSAPEEKPARRRFVTMPSELHRLLLWLQDQGVEEVGICPVCCVNDQAFLGWFCSCFWDGLQGKGAVPLPLRPRSKRAEVHYADLPGLGMRSGHRTVK